MSYKYETQYNSPNYTPGNNGRTMIIIHWWDDPAKNPSYEGTISTLCNPNRGASAHYVATGTGRRVACLVSPDDTAWHAGTSNPATNPNPKSIGIECDPRCRPEDYDVVAELIANIRSAYGNLPLKAHRDFVATQCPGNWDLNRLEALSRTKDGSGDWGVVHDIVPPKPAPVITTKTITQNTPVPFGLVTSEDPTSTETRTLPGIEGKRTITYKITYTDGKETARVEISNVVSETPIDKVIVYGTYKPPVTEEPVKPTEPIITNPPKWYNVFSLIVEYTVKLIKFLLRIK